ncbi:response regulator transcription factor [Marinicrinis lubricantis]|uniref:Response regulator n=1 Tax=Marinicrinis lubricantis TaxID=2086470 RepID=A0ABW1IRZ5_9BACL
MNVLIVDDEPLVRIGIKSAVNWKEEGMTIVGEASDGEEALKLIHELAPDIVILDIKMPKRDGLEVLQRMKDWEMSSDVIVLSSFDDVEHVKQAIKLGAVDYFHKPDMNAEQIISVLRKLKEKRSKYADASDQHHQGNARLFKENELRDWMLGKAEGPTKTLLFEGNMRVFTFKVRSYTEVLQRYTEENRMMLYKTISNITSELLSKENETEFVPIQDNVYCVVSSHRESRSLQAGLLRIQELIQRINSSLKRFVNVETVYAVSDTFQGFRQGHQAFLQAQRAMETSFYHEQEQILYYQNVKACDDTVRDKAASLVSDMKNAIMDERFGDFLNELEEWETTVRSRECLSQAEVKTVYEGLLFMLEDGVTNEHVKSQAEQAESFQKLTDLYKPYFIERSSKGSKNQQHDYSLLIRNILEYVEENYAQNMTLKLLGLQFHASPNYISRLFKQEVGQGLFDYINEVRIKHAKKLLKDYRKKIYEVAEAVGFSSQAHFSIVFQKHEGMPPKEYRNEKV